MGLAESLYAVWKTAAISLPTVAEALVGRVTVEKCDRRLKGWGAALVAKAQVDLHVHHDAPVDWARSYVIMSNHQSHYDIPMLFHVVHGTMRMVTKKELFRVPIWGDAMRASGFVMVDRQDRKQAVGSLKQAADAMRRGTHIWIAPEGTRSRSGELGPFKKGGFHLARDVGVPILPIAISGTRAILPADATIVHTGCRVDVTFGRVIEPTGRPIPEVMDELKRFLVSHLDGKMGAGRP